MGTANRCRRRTWNAPHAGIDRKPDRLSAATDRRRPPTPESTSQNGTARSTHTDTPHRRGSSGNTHHHGTTNARNPGTPGYASRQRRDLGSPADGDRPPRASPAPSPHRPSAGTRAGIDPRDPPPGIDPTTCRETARALKPGPRRPPMMNIARRGEAAEPTNAARPAPRGSTERRRIGRPDSTAAAPHARESTNPRAVPRNRRRHPERGGSTGVTADVEPFAAPDPAHAGINPRMRPSNRRHSWLPGTRGDRPWCGSATRAARRRGDRPLRKVAADRAPHRRGSTLSKAQNIEALEDRPATRGDPPTSDRAKGGPAGPPGTAKRSSTE